MRGLADDLRRVMFPGFFDANPLWDGELEAHITRLCLGIARVLADEVRAVLRYGRRAAHPGFEQIAPPGMSDPEFVDAAVAEFMRRLPDVRRMLMLDVQAAYDGDPAAEHTDEIILCYPGLEAIATHRLAHVLYGFGVPVLARVMSEQAHSRTGIDIHPGAQIGESFFIDHGSATVIGETSVIGKQVKIYQGVTLGARSFPKDERGRVIRGIKRHPTIGDRVTIYAGAVILGGDTVIGDDCVIAGGVFVTSSVAPGHVVQQTRPEPVLKPTAASAVKASGRKIAEGRPDLGWLADGAGI
jgi:serine O-acetyltransferase